MSIASLTAADHRTLLQALQTARRQYEDAATRAGHERPLSDAERAAREEAVTAYAGLAVAENEYFERLPRYSFGVCPFDGRALMRSIDPFDLNAPWWQTDAVSSELAPCPHFCSLTGAVARSSSNFPRSMRPDDLFVLSRLLRYPSMIAVLCCLTLPAGATIYTAAYFAQRRPVPEGLTADWPRRVFVYTTQTLLSGWRLATEERDYDLENWLSHGKIAWCEPGTDNLSLSTREASEFPFVDFGTGSPKGAP